MFRLVCRRAVCPRTHCAWFLSDVYAMCYMLWARCKMQALKGLQGVIGMSATHPTWQKTRPDDDKDG